MSEREQEATQEKERRAEALARDCQEQFELIIDQIRNVPNDPFLTDYTATASLVQYIGSPSELFNVTQFENAYLTIQKASNREIIKNLVERSEYWEKLGITARSLEEIDKRGERATYEEGTRALSEELNRAILGGITRDKITNVFERFQYLQSREDLGQFNAQIQATRADIERKTRERTDYLETPWAMFNNYGQEVRRVSFAPAAVTIIAAPTNHGKTLFLLRSAEMLAEREAQEGSNKTYIFISYEEDQEQLYLRAYNAYINLDFGAGYDNKREIREVVRNDAPPEDAGNDYTQKAERVRAGISEYWERVQPHLLLAHQTAKIETLCFSLEHSIQSLKREGREVAGVFIDYLQLLTSEKKAFSTTDELRAVCYQLKETAQSTGVPIIAAAQMNREGGGDIDKMSTANIGDSAGIERIANDIYLLWQTNKTDPTANKVEFKRMKPKPEEGDKYGRLVGRAAKIVTTPPEESGSVENYDLQVMPDLLYIENLKSRDYKTGGYCLLSYQGATGYIEDTSQTDTEARERYRERERNEYD